MNEEPKLSVIYLRVTRELKQRFAARAAKDGKQQNDLAIEALTEYLKRREGAVQEQPAGQVG